MSPRRLESVSLSIDSAQRDHGILSTKAEAVGQGDLRFGTPGLVGDIVQVAIGIRGVEVDRGGELTVDDRQGRERCLDSTGGSQGVSGHRLGRGAGELPGVLAEDPLDGQDLDTISGRGGGSVGVPESSVVSKRASSTLTSCASRLLILSSLWSLLESSGPRAPASIMICSTVLAILFPLQDFYLLR